MSGLVVLRDAVARYPDGTELRYDGAIDIRAGERVALLGGNGSGKSTLFRLITGLMPTLGGDLRVFGEAPARHFRSVRKRIAVLMQRVEDQLIAPTVYEDVAFTPRNAGWPQEAIDERVSRILTELGLEELKDRPIHDLSGGQRVKVALAGALIVQPEILLLDEPFEHLDPFARREVIDLLNDFGARGIAVLLSTHQINLVPQVADRVIVLARGGRIAMDGTPQAVFGRPEELCALRIEPPILGDLFHRLERFHLGMPRGVEEASQILGERLGGP